MFGYGGRILTVDVGSGAQTIEEFDAAFARTYLGGNGFAVKICFDRIPAGIDPFDPRNLVVFTTGPISETPVAGNSRGCVAGKSPLNGLFLNDNYVRLIHAATGWELDLPELERIGERICTLERAFNVREGIRRKDDTLPWRVQHEPIPDGPSKGCYCPPEELDPLLDEYYALRGWTREGIPTEERLRALGLDFAITG